MGDTGEAPSMKGPSMCYHHQLLSQSLLGYHQHIDQLMFLDFISRTEHTEQSSSLCVLSSVHLVCWWLVTCLWGQYQILLVDLMGRKHLMSVLRVKIQRPPLEGECCISVLSVRGRKPFCSSMPRVFFGIPKNKCQTWWSFLAVLFLVLCGRSLLTSTTDTLDDFYSLTMKVLVPRVTSQRETSCWSERTLFSHAVTPQESECGMGKRVFK